MGEYARAFVPAALVTLAAVYAGHVRGLSAGDLARGMPAVFLLLVGYFAFALPDPVRRLSRWCRLSPLRALLAAQAFLLPYLVYALPLGCFSTDGFLRLLLYVNLPLLALLAGQRWRRVWWMEGVALLLIWLPLDFHLLGPLWSWPPGQSGYFLFGILGVSLAIYLFVVVRGLPEVGYTFSVRARDLGLGVLAFLTFAPVAIGFGLLTGFLHPARHLPSLTVSAARILGIFLATGVPEELLFRGLVQNLIHQWSSSRALSLVLASVIFGAAHLNNGPHPDLRYFALATLAGAVYGVAYQRGRTLMAPALAHTFVDSAWALFFRG